MRVFEFHFNPRLRQGFGGQAKLPDLIFDSFCYEPENIYERRVGSLYLVGFLKNVLPQNLHFLDRLAKLIKDQYYRSTLSTPEKALKESLRQGNEFLEGIAKKGDVSWLGNLSFAVFSLKNFELNFTKVGENKIILVRKGQIIDIDKKLRFQDIEPYPLKIFGNIVSGKLTENDLILVLTKEVFDFFQSQNLLNEIAKILSFDEKKFKSVIQTKEKEFLKISGICLAIFLQKEVGYQAKGWVGKREIISPSSYKEFSLKEAFTPYIKKLGAGLNPIVIVNYFKKLIKKPRWVAGGWRPQFKWVGVKWRPKIKLPQFAIPKFKFPKLNKNLISILALIFCLALGFFIANQEEKQQLKIYQATLDQIQKTVNEAETFLILKKTNPQVEEKANTLFRESWEEISPLVKVSSKLPKNFQAQIFSLEDAISKNLYQLNNLVEISEPELFFEFNPREFVPQKMIVFEKEIYFFSPYSRNLFKVSNESKGEIIEIDKKFNLAVAPDDSILLFSKPNQLSILKEGNFNQFFLETIEGSNYDELSSYKFSLYFLDKKSGEIIKYPYLENFKWDSPQLWLNSQTKKAIEAKSMAIDGSIWILTENNEIDRYLRGSYKETLKLEFWPYFKNPTKIWTSPDLSYLYLLEPAQNRVIVLTKDGKIVKQFKSEKFDNLLDFALSPDGKTIYLLNGLKIYKLQTTSY